MRAYTVATVAVTLNVSPKWVDNALSHFYVNGVLHSRQGVSRRLTPQAVVILFIAEAFVRSIGIGLGDALSLAARINSEGGVVTIPIFPSASLTVDVSATARHVSERLAHAVEVTPVPKRGRPSIK